MHKLLVAALIVGTVFSTFSVSLDKQQIDDIQNIRRQDTKNLQKFNLDKNLQTKNADTVYTFKTKIQGNESNVVFDVSVGENWVYQSSKTPAINGKTEVDAALGRASLVNGQEGEIQSLKFAGHDLKTVNYVNSNTLQETANPQFFKAAQAGFGLNREYETNFFHALEQNKVKIESQYKGFSFYFSQKVNQIFFGQPQEFFANQELESIDAKTAHNAATWTLPVKKGGIELNGVDKLSYTDPTYATFDSTTRYIWASDDLVNSIVSKLNDSRFNCVDANPDHPVGIYNCDGTQDFPTLSITFKTMDNNDGKDSRKYHLRNYVEKLENGKVRLLIRKSAQYQATTNAGATVPSTKISQSENQIVLGTVFLENVYTYFSYENHTVQLAQAYHVQPQRIGIDDTSRIWYLIVGSIFCVVVIGYLLSVMKSVPYDENQAPISQAPAGQSQSQVRNVVYQQPVYQQQPQQVVYQSYHQPATQVYGQPQPYVVSQSPQRVQYIQQQ